MTILFILLLIKYFFVIIKVKVSRSGVIMTNKYRLKIIYKDTKLTLDIDQIGSTVAGANLSITVICEVA